MIGGGTYSFPREFLSKAGRTMDVVELDPAITDIAKEYFHLDPNLPGLHIYSEDGRTFLERASATYASIFPNVYLFRVDDLPDSQLQNIILIATEEAIDFAHAPEEYKEYLSKLYKDPLPETLPPLTDEYAPVEYYSLPLIQSL